MAVKFMTSEWINAIAEAVSGSDDFKKAMGSNSLSLQFEVTGVPHLNQGTYHYHLDAGNGTVTITEGKLEDADASISQNYDTAAAIFRGELNTQTAFISGKIRVSGNMAKLMQHQNAITSFGKAVEGMAVEY